jgi:2-oxoglutarate dehydrogenase E2 component (dihydrolipoamide succinyltransferase)
MTMINIYAPSTFEGTATVVTWHKKQGDYVRANELIVEIEQFQAVYEVSIPTDGILTEIVVHNDSLVVPNQIIGTYTIPGPIAQLTNKLKNFIKGT